MTHLFSRDELLAGKVWLSRVGPPLPVGGALGANSPSLPGRRTGCSHGVLGESTSSSPADALTAKDEQQRQRSRLYLCFEMDRGAVGLGVLWRIELEFDERRMAGQALRDELSTIQLYFS